MQHDDEMVGRIRSRQEVVHLIGAGAAAAVFGGAAGAWPARAQELQNALPMAGCVVRPEQTGGRTRRSATRAFGHSSRANYRCGEGRRAAHGGPDRLRRVERQRRPLAGATVDVWQCDAQGVYSGADDPGFNTAGQKFLRGVQTTDAKGARSSRPSTRAGTGAGPFTSTSRSARSPLEVRGSSRRNGTSTRRRTIAS